MLRPNFFDADVQHWQQVRELLDTLYSTSGRLEALFPGRKFTLDGHLVGSVGEVIASYMFDINLEAASNCGYDAVCAAGRCVEIKMTQGNGIGIRHEPQHLIVLQRGKAGPTEVVFNGPGAVVWAAAGKMAKNGQKQISVSRLRMIQRTVDEDQQLPRVREAPV